MKSLLVAVCASSVVVSVACSRVEKTNESGHAARPAVKPLIFSPNPITPPPCSTDPNPYGTVVYVVRVVIKPNTDFANPPTRQVQYFTPVNPSSGDTEANHDGDKGIDLPGVDANQPFDMDLTKILPVIQTSRTEYVEIRVLLRDNKYTFWPAYGGGAIGAPLNNSSTLKLCGGTIDENNPNAAIVYIPYGSDKQKIQADSYTIALTPSAAKHTPILIDPQIRNNG